MSDFTEIWVYLSSSPLLHLTLTLIAYQIGDWAYKRSGGLAILNPVLLAVAMLVAVLLITDTDYGTYFEGAQFVHFLLAWDWLAYYGQKWHHNIVQYVAVAAIDYVRLKPKHRFPQRLG